MVIRRKRYQVRPAPPRLRQRVRETEARLRLSEERLRLALEANGDGLWDYELASGSVWLSPESRALVGATGEVVESGEEPLHSVLFPSDPAAQDCIRAHLRGDTPRVEYECRIRTGARAARWLLVRGKVVERGPDAAPRRLAGTLSDTTARKALESQLSAADRMASMGVLATGMGHEINNPLGALLSSVADSVESLHAALRRGDLRGEAEAEVRSAYDALGGAAEAGEQVHRIVERVRAFSTPELHDSDQADVRAVVRLALRIAERSIGGRARLELDLASVPPVRAPEYQLAHVVLDLLLNAAQAIDAGERERNWIRVRTGSAGRFVVIEVQDTGVGMPSDLMARVFDPFFTTRRAGNGAGLGLSACHGIVSALGGRIEVESTPGKGSSFRVLLPARLPARIEGCT